MEWGEGMGDKRMEERITASYKVIVFENESH